MGTARKLALSDPNATKARLTPGRQWIGIKNLEAPDELQPRAGIDKDWVSQLEGFRRDGSEFPPARVYQLADGRLMLAEGHHRRWALLGAGEADMLCEVVDGTMKDAIGHAAGSNKSNGVKPMGSKDVTKAIEMLFGCETWWQKADTLVARHVGCSPQKARVVRVHYAEKNNLVIPKLREEADGRICQRTKSGAWRRDIDEIAISTRGSQKGFTAKYRHCAYVGTTIQEVRDKLTAIMREEEKRLTSIQTQRLTSRLSEYGFRSFKWSCSKTPGFLGWYGHGIVIAACDFMHNVSLVETKGNLKLLAIAVGRVDANRMRDKHATRSIILCFKEDGPQKAIELFESSGIEFMTPDELIRSLGANGMTPDEVAASLKEKTK